MWANIQFQIPSNVDSAWDVGYRGASRAQPKQQPFASSVQNTKLIISYMTLANNPKNSRKSSVRLTRLHYITRYKAT